MLENTLNPNTNTPGNGLEELTTIEQPSTIATFEFKTCTYFIDYHPENGVYMVFRDEKWLLSFKTIGEALEYIFRKIAGRGECKVISMC